VSDQEYFRDATFAELQEILDLVDELSPVNIDQTLRWMDNQFAFGAFHDSEDPSQSWSGARWYINRILKGPQVT
jgi:hypothetical protein